MDEFWTHKNMRLGAAIQAMFVAVVVMKEQGYDPVKVCKLLSNGKKLKEVIGRNPYKEKNDGRDS